MRTILFFLSVLKISFLLAGNSTTSQKFDFGTGEEAKGYKLIQTAVMYSDDLGYGFDYGTTANGFKSGKDALTGDFFSSNTPFYFSVKLPEGHYKVTLYLGDAKGESVTTVKAESRRLMLEKIKTPKGKIVKKTFTVNVRTPVINDSTSIKLKSREQGYLNWDNKLTLEFTGQRPCLCALEIEKTEPAVTFYLAGNSTVTDQEREPYASWGQMITAFLKPDVSVANYAESGESMHSFYHSKRLDKILSVIKPGDYLFIEFGHNDQKLKGEGVGPWTSFKDYLNLFIDKTTEKGANPVLITPMCRRSFDSTGHIQATHGDYPEVIKFVAKERNVPVIDLQEMSKILYESMGMEASKKLFCHYPVNTYPGQDKKLEDNTHFNNFGAYQIAKCIIKGIKDNYPDLMKYFIEGIPDYHPSFPDDGMLWDLPESPLATNVKPDGN